MATNRGSTCRRQWFVGLVSMPFKDLLHPPIQLGILESVLAKILKTRDPSLTIVFGGDVVAAAEDDRDACGRSLGRLSNGGLTGRSDNGYATADEVSHERRQAIVSALQPVVFDHHVLAL